MLATASKSADGENNGGSENTDEFSSSSTVETVKVADGGAAEAASEEGEDGSCSKKFHESLNTLSDIRNYEEMDVIGTGAYGTVYKAKDVRNKGKIVALKKFRLSLSEGGIPMSTIREISILKSFEKYQHPNIVRLYDICNGRKLYEEQQLVLFLVFEHVEQDLAQYLERCPSPGLGPDRIKDIIFQVLCGVDFLHTNRVVHRDLKPQNILITNEGQVKLADFGLARTFESYTLITAVVVTLWYRSPEVLLQSSYATPVDIWSCGCIFAELFTRKALFRGQSELDQLIKVFEIIGTPSEDQWPDNVLFLWSSFQPCRGISLDRVVNEMCPLGTDLFKKMLIFDANDRISASEAVNHEYFREDNLFPLEFHHKGSTSSPPPLPPHHHHQSTSSATSASSKPTASSSS